MSPSMEQAAEIRDVAARHTYVFDNGMSSPDFYDVDKRMASEEFATLKTHCSPAHRIVEIGCLTGLNLLGLARHGCTHLTGLDFVRGAVDWLDTQSHKEGRGIRTLHGTFPDRVGKLQPPYDRAICFDVLEHQLDVGRFLRGTSELLAPGGLALFLVPEGRHYFDCGHVAFWPDAPCLHNTLDYFFEVTSIRQLDSCPKLFAVCQRRN